MLVERAGNLELGKAPLASAVDDADAPAERLRRAHALYRAGSFAEAAALCEPLSCRVHASHASHAVDALLLLAACAAKLRALPQSIEFSKRALELQPHSAEAHQQLAKAVHEMGRADIAASLYQRAGAIPYAPPAACPVQPMPRMSSHALLHAPQLERRLSPSRPAVATCRVLLACYDALPQSRSIRIRPSCAARWRRRARRLASGARPSTRCTRRSA